MFNPEINFPKYKVEQTVEFTPGKFLEQLTESKKLNVEVMRNGKKEYHDIKFNEINPENSSDEPTILYVGGYNAESVAYTEPIYHAVKSGRKVVFINPMKGFRDDAVHHFLHKNEISCPNPIEERGAEIISFMKNYDNSDKKFDVIGHSLGGAVGVFSGVMFPDKVRNLILDNPAGLDGRKNIFQMLKEYNEEGKSELEVITKRLKDNPNEDLKFQLKEWHNKSLGQKLRSKEEGYLQGLRTTYGISKLDISPLLKFINENKSEEGPKIKLVTGQNDRMFTPEQLENTLGTSIDEVSQYIDGWSQYVDRDVGHGFWTKHSLANLQNLENNKELPAPNKQTEALLELLNIDF